VSPPDLWGLFSELSNPAWTEVVQLAAAQIPGRPGDYIARGSGGEAVVLLRGSHTPAVKPPLLLRHIEVDYGSRCRIAETDLAPVDGEFIAIRCAEESQQVLELFVRTVEAILATLPKEPSATQAEALIAGLVELFRKLSQPPRRSIKGLWAELFVIERSAFPEAMVAAWHSEADEKFDFASERGYLEVKATEQSVRIHEFSLAQLRPKDGTPVIVASLMLRREAGGASVLDLARRIDKRLAGNSQLRAKLWRNLAAIVGLEFEEAVDVSFSETLAAHELKAIDAATIPCVERPLPPGVLDVRLKMDITAPAQNAPQGQSTIDQRMVVSV
jgi:hypothetical protein